MTISQAACASIDRMFEQTLRDISVVDADECCSLSLRDPASGKAMEAAGRLATCNISAFGFRIVIFYAFGTDDGTADFLRRKFRLAEDDGGFPADACGEFINMSVGAAKGMLTMAMPNTGMSTPVFLEPRCRTLMAALKPAHARTVEVVTACGCQFEVTYCVSVGSKSKVDFTIDTRAPEPESVGELELF